MGFGEQTEDRDLPHYIVVGTEHPDGGTGYYAATRAGLVRVTPVLHNQAIAASFAEMYDRQMRGTTMEDLMYIDPVLEEDEEPEYRRVKTPVADADYFIAAGGNVALGVEAPHPLNLSEEQTTKVASALLTFNLLGFRVRLERIHD